MLTVENIDTVKSQPRTNGINLIPLLERRAILSNNLIFMIKYDYGKWRRYIQTFIYDRQKEK